MCMSSVYFNMEQNNVDKDWVGTGYKHISSNMRANGFTFQLNKWLTDTNTNPIRASSKKSYPAGFHLFLTREEAAAYAGKIPNSKNVHEVKFKDIVSVGRNRITNGKTGVCIIARQIKIMNGKK